MGFGDWGLGIGDWGLGIGDWAQSPIPNPQSPNPILRKMIKFNFNFQIISSKFFNFYKIFIFSLFFIKVYNSPKELNEAIYHLLHKIIITNKKPC